MLGVGTNYFPCGAEQIPRLRGLLSGGEFRQVEAFPSVGRGVPFPRRALHFARRRDESVASTCSAPAEGVAVTSPSNHPPTPAQMLRLIFHGRLLPALAAAKRVARVAFHRVIDNAPLELDAEQLWVALNFQLVHLLDFLPVVDWEKELARDLFLFNFAALYKLLEQRGRLDARVDLSLARPRASPYAPDPKRLSLGDLIRDYVPAANHAAPGKKEIATYSGAIGPSLDFTIRT